MNDQIRRPREKFAITYHGRGMRPHGRVHFDVWERGKLLYTLDRDNLVVNGVIGPLAQLLGGDTANQSAGAIGFGSSAAPPTVTDTALTNPAYYKALDSHSYPGLGSVQFNWSLQVTDYGAVGLNISEFGLFANTGPALLPAARGTSFPTWAASTAEAVGNTITDSNGNLQVSTALAAWASAQAYTVGQLVLDSNGNIQCCTTAGTSGGSHPTWASTLAATTADGSGSLVWTVVAVGSTGTTGTPSHPTWATSVGGVTLDNAVMWTLSSLGAAPSMTLLSHFVLPSPVAFGSMMSLAGFWIETF